MKPHILPAAAALAILAIAASCKPRPKPEAPPAEPAAATAPAPSPGGQPQAGGDRPGGQGNFQQRAEQRMQEMKTALGLTDDQAQKIRAVFDGQFAPLRAQMADSSLSRDDRRAAFEKARAAANAQIEQILTPEQKPKWEALQQQMEQRRNQRRQQHGGGN